jgi:hypothetical protein
MITGSGKSAVALIFLGLLSALIAGCAAHIRPNPNFTWPEMADSKVSGKLAVYITPNAADKIVKNDPASEFHHSDLLIGQAAVKLTEQACLSVFDSVEILKQLPDIAKLKAAGYRGVIKLDSIITEITLPTKSAEGDSVSFSDISIRLGLSYSAEDFLIDQMLPPSFGPDGQYGKKMNQQDMKKLDGVLKDITGRILDESGKILAQSLVNIYGAR